LSIALKAADVCSPEIQGRLAVVPKGWMPQVMGQASHIDKVWINSKRIRQLATDLSNFKGVGQSRASEIA
jgi:hypothetical protein